MYSLYKKAAFKLDPELAHDLTNSLLKNFPRVASLPYQLQPDQKLSLSTQAGEWSFPVGVAAGLDKKANLISFF